MDIVNKQRILELDHSIIEIVRREQPETVEQLIKFVQLKNNVSEKIIMERILLLQDQGKIIFKDQLLSYTLRDYMFSVHAYWYLLIVALATITASLIGLNLQNVPVIGNVFIFMRYLFGSIFVLFLPGYSFVKALMPGKAIDQVERAALSIGMSLAIVGINALIINYTPWGISTVSLTISLLALTFILSTTAVVREHQKLSTK
jgi:uncharacterized membrane protein